MNEVVRAAGLLIFRKQPELKFLLLKERSIRALFSNFEYNGNSDPKRRIMENGTGQ